jgi:hypothetical protein
MLVIMSPAANDLYSDTLSLTKDNGELASSSARDSVQISISS